MAARGKRKRKETCPNQLFVSWLSEWKEEAERSGWKSASTFSKALTSLKKYPLKLASGKECKILMHFGDKICSMIDKKLQDHNGHALALALSDDDSTPCTENLTDAALKRGRRRSHSTTSCNDNQPSSSKSIAMAEKNTHKEDTSEPRTASGGRAYNPLYRSGSYAILLTLYIYTKLEKKCESMNKSDLIRLAQPHCDKSLTQADSGTFYTAFSSMTTLISKGLVSKSGCPVRYALTDDGERLAETLHIKSSEALLNEKIDSPVKPSSPRIHVVGLTSAADSQTDKLKKPFFAFSDRICVNPDDNLVQTAATGGVHSFARPNKPLFSMSPGAYEIILIIDSREHYGFGRAKQQLLPALIKNAVKVDLRPLSVGDFVWIARSKDDAKKEAVLDFIIERKRLDDLSGSIVDGRYKEQKLRMKESGLRKPIYLVEYYKTQANERIKEDTLMQAVMNTQIIDEFYVKRCNNILDCTAYVTLLHQHIMAMYQKKKIHVYSRDELPDLPFVSSALEMCHLTYDDFTSCGVKSKPLSVKELWCRMLMVIPGVSVDKAQSIVDKFPTFQSLMKAYASCDSDITRVKLLSGLTFGASNRKIGEALSRSICHLLNTRQPLL